MLDVLFLAAGILVSVLTGLFVVTRGPKNLVNRLYGLLTVSLVVLALANYLSLQTDERLFYIRAVIFSSTLIVASLYYLLVNLQPAQTQLSKFQRFGIYFTVIVAVMDWTPLVFSGLTEGPDPVPTPGPAAILFIAHLIIFLTSASVLLFQRFLRLKGRSKQQSLYMLIGVAPIFLLSPITGVALPIAFKNPDFIFLTPVYTTFFVVMVGYAIVRHGLFDIRLVVVRAVAYTLSLMILGLLYGLVAFVLLNNIILDTNEISLQQQTIYTLLAVAMAFVFYPTKRFFDRVTNSLFYQDAYDPQTLLDDLNQVLVSNIELQSMLEKSAATIQQYLKTEYSLFGLKETNDKKQRIIGTVSRSFAQSDIDLARRTTPHIHHKVIVTDILEPPYTKLKNILEKDDIAVLVRLVDSTAMEEEGLGYLVLGRKKSGNPYNSQDVKMLEIIANELVIAIQNALRFEEIQNFNITLQEEVERQTKQLRAANQRLKLLDQTKDDFISMASHQLRTPLTSVKGYLSMTLEGDAGKVSPKQRKLLSQAFISSQRMVYLIADMLNVSRLKTGKFIIEPEPTDLADAVQTEIDQLKGTAEARGLKLRYKKPKDFPILMLDQTKIRQVIMNFADNAIYYSSKGGHIDVELKDTGKDIELTVTDDGIGVPKSEQHHLFSKFYRAGNAKKIRPDGTGLGLYMAKKVIIGHSGHIIFHSKEGKGSTFGFRLPKSKLKPSQATTPTKTKADELDSDQKLTTNN